MKKSIWGLVLAVSLVLLFWTQAASAQAVSAPGVEMGTITPNGPAIQRGVLGAGGQAVLVNYRFTVDDPVRASLSYSILGGTGDATIRTLTGGVIDDNSTALVGGTYANVLHACLMPGTYYATIEAQGAGVSYKIELTTVSIASEVEAEPNDDADSAVGITYAGQVKAALCGHRDVDVFKVSVPEGIGKTAIRVSMTDGTPMARMKLSRAGGQQVAEEDLAGKATGTFLYNLAAGDHLVRFEAGEGHTGRYQFAVRAGVAVESVSVAPNPATIAMGTGRSFEVTTKPTITDEVIQSVVSSDEAIAKVRDIAASGFGVNALAIGECTVTVTMSGGKKAVVPVTVAPPAMESISLPAKVTLTVGFDYMPIQPSIVPANAAMPQITWTSSKPKVLAVGADGTLSALKVGTVTLTATAAGGASAQCAVTVSKNVYKGSLPYIEGKEDEYVSSAPKRIYYKGSYIYFEIYLLNCTNSKISRKGTWEFVVYDLELDVEKPIYTKKIKWNFGTIKKGGHKVYKIKLPKKKFAKRDLAGGQLFAAVGGALNERNLTHTKGMQGDVRLRLPTLVTRQRGLNHVGRSMREEEFDGDPYP